MIHVLLLALPALSAGGESMLWRIGNPDGGASDLGLAPAGYARFSSDPLFVVGQSKDGDWPYVLPGPEDGWAGGRTHQGDIYFGLRSAAISGCTLHLRLRDAQHRMPPELLLSLNGKLLRRRQTPPGKNDDVVEGRALSGTKSEVTATLPPTVLKKGNNVISIRNGRGSWAIFDTIEMDGPDESQIEGVEGEISVRALPQRQAILRTPAGPRQPLSFEVTNIGPARTVFATAAGRDGKQLELQPGRQTVEIDIAPLKSPKTIPVVISSDGLSATAPLAATPVRPWQIYLFPHAHVDIGYTGIQSGVLAMQERNLLDAIEVAKESGTNPKDSRYRFSEEAEWVVDRFLGTANKPDRDRVIRAIKNRTISVSGDYANLLTGVMHPEELMQSYRDSRILQERVGVAIDTASQTDVPAATWGDVVALHEAGIKYLVLMPNPDGRIGGIRRAWEDHPFYWVGPSGKDRVMVWQTEPYSVGVGAGWDGDRDRIYRSQNPSARFIQSFIFEKLGRLAQANYPYDVVGEPWSVTDNPPIDGDVPKAAKEWNEEYVYPHVVLTTLTDACHAFEARYGKVLPVAKGDYTPYWEDGVGSTALETSINRTTPDRLLQASALYAMRKPDAFPVSVFSEAWKNVILFSEHTWGAANSISEPDAPEVKAQWAVKRQFALSGDAMSRSLLAGALRAPVAGSAFDVVNTSSWPRTDLVRLSAEQSKAGDRVVDERGAGLPSQRLHSGELAILVSDVPAFGSKRIRLVPGRPHAGGKVIVDEGGIFSQYYRIRLNRATKLIESIREFKSGKELANPGGYRINQFLYLPGVNLKDLQTSSHPRVEIMDKGPLVATLRITSDAPGARSLTQEISLVAGLDRIDFKNEIDKLAVRTPEGVHFSFPYNVPAGQVRIGLPWAVMRPELDQIPGSNKNWMTTRGFVDVSNGRFGVTTVSLDAPLMEVGEISANVLGSQWNPDEWRQHIRPTQTFFSWALNNHWFTNYKADQSGPLTFRYRVRAHGALQSDAASRLGLEAFQPLLVSSVAAGTTTPLLTLSTDKILVTRLSPACHGHALIVRLWNSTANAQEVTLKWRRDVAKRTWFSDLTERRIARCGSKLKLPGWGVKTLLVDR